MRDVEKLLNLIYSNEVVMEALRQVFDEEAMKHLPRINGQSNDILGQEYRSHNIAKEIIEDAFIRIKMMKGNETSTNGIKYK